MMKQIMVKLFNWQALLASARMAVSGLLPSHEAETDGPPHALLADFGSRSALLAFGGSWGVQFAGRYALASPAGNNPSRFDAPEMANRFPHSLSFRKETPGLQAASPESSGQRDSTTGSPHVPQSSKSIGPPEGEVIMPIIDAAQIAKFRKDTLEDFDDLDEYAEELGLEQPSETAKACARQLVLRLFEEDPDNYIICPEAHGRVSIGFTKGENHFCTIICNADGHVVCIVSRNSNTSNKTYESIDGLPDDYMRKALAPQPGDYTS